MTGPRSFSVLLHNSAGQPRAQRVIGPCVTTQWEMKWGIPNSPPIRVLKDLPRTWWTFLRAVGWVGSCLFLPLFLISNHDRRSLQHVVSRLIFFFPDCSPRICSAAVQEPHSFWWSWFGLLLFGCLLRDFLFSKSGQQFSPPWCIYNSQGTINLSQHTAYIYR